ncbi:MAG: riboflavin synthase [Candidatus Eisenbacteria bacterium]
MFTGIIEEVGRIAARRQRGEALEIEVAAEVVTEDLGPGDSVSVSGVCLTVKEIVPGGFRADVVSETTRRTYLGRLRPGDRVNLERALRAGDRFGGHIVQGHVDGVGAVAGLRPEGEGKTLLARVPGDLKPYVVEKGSVALDGVSLTVAGVEGTTLRIALVPTTLTKTTLGEKRPGDPLHVETDVIGKYVEKMTRREGKGLAEWLRESEHE